MTLTLFFLFGVDEVEVRHGYLVLTLPNLAGIKFKKASVGASGLGDRIHVQTETCQNIFLFE